LDFSFSEQLILAEEPGLSLGRQLKSRQLEQEPLVLGLGLFGQRHLSFPWMLVSSYRQVWFPSVSLQLLVPR